MKSVPRKTPSTPSFSKIRTASGDFSEVLLLGKSAVPDSKTVFPGKNFKVGSLIDESDYEDIVKKINKK